MTDVGIFKEKSYGPYEYEIDKTKIVHSCREHWIKSHQRIPARCGISGTMEFQSSHGILRRELISLESTLEGTIGAKDLATLKSKVTEKFGAEIAISEETSKKLSLSCPAVRCGSAIYHLYNLVRDHRFDFYRSRLFRRPSVTTETIREFSSEYEMLIESEPDDPNCPCAPELGRIGGGLVRLFAKRLRITLEYDRMPDGTLQFQIGMQPYLLNSNLIDLRVSSLPQSWAELAGLSVDLERFPTLVEFVTNPEDEPVFVQSSVTPEEGSGSPEVGEEY